MNDQTGYPDNNPKTQYGIKKVPLHLVPPAAKFFMAEAFADGAEKYGPYNWRDKKVSASVYMAALMRHMDAWWDGEDFASDSGKHHIGHAMACLGILADAMTVGKLNDDRPTKGAAAQLQRDYTPTQNQEKEKHDDQSAASNEPDLYDWRHAFNPDAVVGSGVSDVSPNLFPSDPNGDGWQFLGWDGAFEYWRTPDGGMVRYNPTSGNSVPGSAVSELFSGRGEPFNSLYDLTQRDGSGSLPVATRDGDG